MRDKIIDFAKSINVGDTVLFYYSGHGVQIEQENYLIPTRADIEITPDIERETFKLDYAIDVLKEKSHFLFIVVDASRDNPIKSKSLSFSSNNITPVNFKFIKSDPITYKIASSGLKPMMRDYIENQITILYSTRPYESASDQHPIKRNLGLFAGEFIELINKTDRIH